MFYTAFYALCKQKGVRPGRVADAIGMSRGTITRWKQKGYTPRKETMEKIAAYFGVDVAELKPTTPPDRNELEDYLDMLKNREECRMLFSLARNATKDDVMRAVRIIELLRTDEVD